MGRETKPNYGIIPFKGSSSDKGDAGYIIKLDFNSDVFADSIFEITDDTSESFMRVYSLWVETNVLYRVVESILDIYGIISESTNDVFNNKNLMDFEIIDEQILFNGMYDYLFELCDGTFLKNRKMSKYGHIGSEIICDFCYFKEILDPLRGRVVDAVKPLEDKIPDSYNFGDLLAETVTKLMNLCSDDGNGIKWYTEICFNRVNTAEKFQNIIYPVFEEQNCGSYSFTGEKVRTKKS